MDRLNYHHLYYFWTVARLGSVTHASRELRLAQPTLSSQIKTLETAMGLTLFERRGRRLRLTDAGRFVLSRAEQIFSLGQDLTNRLTEKRGGIPQRLTIGVADVLPDPLVMQFLEPVLHLTPPAQIFCQKDTSERLILELVGGNVDLALTDTPLSGSGASPLTHHLLGRSDIEFLAVPGLAERYRRGFPRSLHRAPLILPYGLTNLRRALDQWFLRLKIQPRIVGEFLDRGLLMSVGASGAGLFPSPTLISASVRKQFGVSVVGRVPSLFEQFYAISLKRHPVHPAIQAIHSTFGPRSTGIGLQR